MFSGNNYSLADIAAATGSTKGGNGFMDGGWAWWIIILLIFVCGGNWGLGGNNGGGANAPAFQGWATRSDIQESFATNNLQGGINSLQQGICDSTYALNNAINSGFNNQSMAIMQGVNGLQSQLANCCCGLESAIQGINYNMSTQSCDIKNTIQNTTRDIIDNQNANNRALMDFLVNDKIATLTAENQSLKFQASQNAQNAFITANQDAQTAELIRRIAPPPVPAYTVPAPYGYGSCNNACAC